MYRIVCESYINYKKDFLMNDAGNHRYEVAKPLELMVDLSLYEKEKNDNSIEYQKLQHFIYLLKNNIKKYPNYKSLLWSLESREIYGKNYNILSQEEFNELAKIINGFLKLAYWES
jgi:hypothetical protein